MEIENVYDNGVLDDCGFEALRDYGVQSITVNHRSGQGSKRSNL